LLWGSGAVFAFPNVFHFFAHKLARLSGRRLAFPLIFARAFNYFVFRHNKMITPLERCLDVNNKAAEVTSCRFVVSKEAVLSSALLTALLTAPLSTAALLTAALLTATLLTAALSTAALLTATLFFALAPLSLAILLFALLFSAGRFARLVWILWSVHDAFLCY
jgi:hypothetical protein